MNYFNYSKYGVRTDAKGKADRTWNNILFSSKKEMGRYKELLILEKVGQITDLELQPLFILQVGFQKDNIKYRAITYIADFQYKENGKTVVEDVKGYKTETYEIKKKLFLYNFPSIKFVEI